MLDSQDAKPDNQCRFGSGLHHLPRTTHQSPGDSMFGSRRSRIVLVLGLLVFSVGGLVAWRLYTTRTAYLLERGQAALERGAWDEAARRMRALDRKDSPSAT